MTGIHIGYVVKMYPKLSETFIVNEILEMERVGAQVTIFSLRLPNEGRFHRKLAQVAAHVVHLPAASPAACTDLLLAHAPAFRSGRRELGELLWSALESGNHAALREFGNGLFLAKEARNRGIDHLHAHFATVPSTVARIASRLTSIPFSFTAHAKDIYHDSVDRNALQTKIDDAAFVVTVCDANRNYLLESYPSRTTIHRIYNGLDLVVQSFRERNGIGPLKLLGVGRLVAKKGFDTLVDACAVLNSRGVDIECRIIGGGVERDSLDSLVDEHGIRDCVHLLGPQTDREVRMAMDEADIFVLPARIAPDGNRDALPTVLLEALATGLPAVSTDVTGIAEILGEDAGELVPIDDAVALAVCLEALAANPGRRQELALTGRARAESRFDIRKNLSPISRLFQSSAESSKKDVAPTAIQSGATSGIGYAPRLS